MSGRISNFTLRGRASEGQVVASSRRKIEPEDIAFGRRMRERMGWQTIAKIRGVNEVDLRRACETADAIAAPQPARANTIPVSSRAPEASMNTVGATAAASPRAAAARKPRLRPAKPAASKLYGNRQMQVLAAVDAGMTSHDEIAAHLGIDPRNSVANVSILRRKGLLRGAYGDWCATPAGLAALKAWGAGRE
jgi:hypothetical protein